MYYAELEKNCDEEIYKVIDHWGVVDEVASANTYDASKRDYWNDDRPYDNPDDYTKPGLQGYKYIMPGTYVTYYDDFGNPVTTTSVETGYIIGECKTGAKEVELW